MMARRSRSGATAAELREFIFMESAAKIVGSLALSSWAGVVNVASGRSYGYLDVIDGVSRTWTPAKDRLQTAPQSLK